MLARTYPKDLTKYQDTPSGVSVSKGGLWMAVTSWGVQAPIPKGSEQTQVWNI